GADDLAEPCTVEMGGLGEFGEVDLRRGEASRVGRILALGRLVLRSALRDGGAFRGAGIRVPAAPQRLVVDVDGFAGLELEGDLDALEVGVGIIRERASDLADEGFSDPAAMVGGDDRAEEA